MQTTLARTGFLLLFLCPVLAAAQDLDSLLNMSAFTEESELQKHLNQSTTISSSRALTTRETPGILSVVTAEEIENSGARDLIDILRLVPGFDVAQDLQFVLGLSLRGNWANEGKILVLLDGQPLNELLYQTVAVGNRFPVDAIERVEVIRGPGSAIYGGSAEYGVINIITKAAESLDGVAAYGTVGLHNKATGRSNGGVMMGMKRDDFSWDLSVFKGASIASDQLYQDLYQEFDPQDLSRTTYADPMNVNMGVRYKGLVVRGMYDEFKASDPWIYTSFKNYFGDVRYHWKASDKITIVPQLKYYHQEPWTWGDNETNEYYFNVQASRVHSEVAAVYDVSRKVNINFGGLYFRDKGLDLMKTDLFRGENELVLDNYAFFAQALFRHRLANATLGFRYEKNSYYGAAFVPRMALTKKIENLHFKVLYSQAFRAPSIQNINIALNNEIKPEKSNVFEFELGYQFTPEMLFAVNVFSLTTRDILAYGSEGTDDDFVEWYENATKTGTRGVEAIYSIRRKGWYGQLTYSYSQAIPGDASVASYTVPQTTKQYIAMLAHKATANAGVYLTGNLSVSPSLILGGKRYGYTEIDEEEEPVITELPAYVLANVFVNYRNLFADGLNAGFGVYDLLNERPAHPQAYNGGYAPLPGRSREWVIKLSYKIDFRK